MEFVPTISGRLSRIPRLVWIGALIGVVALIAIFGFNFAAGTVVSYAFFALLCGSHLFMHGSHGGQQHTNHAPSSLSSQARPEKAIATGDHADHSKGCH